MARFVKIDKNFGTLMTMHEFVESVNCTALTDYDGYGCYSDGVYEDTLNEIYPSMVDNDTIDLDKTHIIWYNK